MPNLVLWIGGVLAAVSAAAGVIGFFRANVSKATIELYRQDNDALRARLHTVEEQQAADAATIHALKASRDYLMSVLTQAEALKALREVVDRIASKVGAA